MFSLLTDALMSLLFIWRLCGSLSRRVLRCARKFQSIYRVFFFYSLHKITKKKRSNYLTLTRRTEATEPTCFRLILNWSHLTCCRVLLIILNCRKIFLVIYKRAVNTKNIFAHRANSGWRSSSIMSVRLAGGFKRSKYSFQTYFRFV